MKLTIGENIRRFRKKHDLTQEALAERLGVTYQSVSRWENGSTYPDLELLPAISETLSVTVDELIGMPKIEKEKRASETVDELCRECRKQEYDADRIVEILRDIRLNYIGCEGTWSLWAIGLDRAFHDPAILPEVRLLANACLECAPMHECVINTMSRAEDEEHIEAFLEKCTTAFDCSARELLFMRYWWRRDAERFEKERLYRAFQALDRLFDDRSILPLNATAEDQAAAIEFTRGLLDLIRNDITDDHTDMWVERRLSLGLDTAARMVAAGRLDEAMQHITSVVDLLEDVMSITEKVLLPTSCHFLTGMVWYAEEHWHTFDNHPDALKERCIYLHSHVNEPSQPNNVYVCNLIFPSLYYHKLQGDAFAPLHSHPEFEALCNRVKVLVVTKEE